MAEISLVLLILVPLGLLVFLSLALLRMGMRASEMTDAARQRTAGCGIMLLYLSVLGLTATIIMGFYRLSTGVRWFNAP